MFRKLFVICLLLSFLAAGCAPQATPAPAQEPTAPSCAG